MLESILEFTFADIALTLVSACSVLALFVSVYNSQVLAKQKRQYILRNRRLQEDMRALSKSAVGMGHKVLKTERKLMEVLKTQTSILNTNAEHPSYDQAGRLIAMGATEDDLVNTCGFSHGEAELLLSLKKHSHTGHVSVH
jgi:transcriptional regulator of NAD metabolism